LVNFAFHLFEFMEEPGRTNYSKEYKAPDDIVLEVKENAPLMKFLILNLKNKSRDNIKSLLRNKHIWINNQAVSQFDHPLSPGQQVLIKRKGSPGKEIERKLHIVFEDDHIIVIDKSAGLLSVSTGVEGETANSILSDYVKKENPQNKIFVVHRLDRDTSGLMLFSKSERIQSLLQNSWQTSVTERTYFAVVEGVVKKPADTIRTYLYESSSFFMHVTDDPEKGELAVTHYKVLKTSRDYSLIEVDLETGKKNQIRVHMQSIGHPVVGDKKYGTGTNPVGRLGLHAGVLAFIHPETREPMRFVSKMPASFLRLF
jgi:23S rRNA pseudouridine1911/1915/1917 synthase